MVTGSFLRTGAIGLVAGLVLVFATTAFHPSREDPGDAPAAFREYAESATWVGVHAAQFLAVCVLTGGLVCLHAPLEDGPGRARVPARLGLAAAAATLATFAALQAVDGVALKLVVDRWVAAPPAEQAAAFRVAEAVRWVEVGLNGYFRILLGLTLVLYGAAILGGAAFPRWAGALGVVAGLASVWHGILVGHAGFGHEGAGAGLLATVLYSAWFLVVGALMWRRAGRPSEP